MKPHKPQPPELAQRFLQWFLRDELAEEVEGDLEEKFLITLEHSSVRRARLNYWYQVFHYLRPFALRKLRLDYFSLIYLAMLRSYFTISWRNAVRQKQFTILNLLGLTIGIATCIVIGLYVHNELSYDAFHTRADRIYRINQSMIWDNWDEPYASTGPNVAVALQEDIPELEEVTRILKIAMNGGQTLRIHRENEASTIFIEEKYFAVDENFFDVFTFDFIRGNPLISLVESASMVMTEETAERYFGSENPIGKAVEVKQSDGIWRPFTVTGVLANLPHQSHLQFDLLVSLNSFDERMKRDEWKWVWTAFSTYGLVKEGTDIAALTEKLQAIPPKWAATTTKKIFNQTVEEFTGGKPWRLYLQPLREIYLSKAPAHHLFGPNANPQIVTIFMAIGGLVLLLCSINFMNLTTARSANRAKEVGIKKFLGFQKKSLVVQFTFESVLFVAVSTLAALILAQLSLDWFNEVADKHLKLLSMLTDPTVLGIILAFVLFLGVLAGSYPAFYLSSFAPFDALSGKVRAGFKGKTIRNGLVIFQFTISITLIICTFFVQEQLTYTSSLDLGIAKDNILQIHHVDQLGADTETLKAALAEIPAFINLGISYAIPPHIWDGERYRAAEPESKVIDISNFRAEGDYLDLLGAEFLAGRNFDSQRLNDRYGVILNEAAVKELGWGTPETYDIDSPIGKMLVGAFGDEDEMEVLGVVRNFNFNSVRENIRPLVILNPENDRLYNYGTGRYFLSLRINPQVIDSSGKLQSLITQVKEVIAEIDSSIPFEYSFVDQEFENTFRSEQRMGFVLNLFTLMALIIACLGLFGLAAFSAEQRTKELSIRKVLGARVSELIFTFSIEFTKLILISVVLASPIAYVLVDAWLNDFAYRTPIHLWVFIVAIVGILGIAITTISLQSVRTARANPVDNLRSE
uniref:ABC transporter permease n=1 Tax=Roseihalotalea indica TaxID=2867963 RepID=A0AA49JIS2_9BACT|nr:ABC transporter permease [Tunicatimonas sp. TK19036]